MQESSASLTSESASTLVLFDFDGTITRKDSLFDFIKYYWGAMAFYWGMFRLSPILIVFKLGFIPNWKAKERVLTYFFRHEPVKKFQQRCDEYARQRLPHIVKDSAIRKIREFQQQGADIYLVSASAENWLQAWCESLGIHLLATRLEVKDGGLTGKIMGSNCHGPEKVARIRCAIDVERYEKIYGYGDSKGDRDMLALAHFPHYRFFT